MRILLTEDDKDLSKAVTKVLKLNNYEVDCAFDGIEALDYLNYNSYDLVIMDIMMPRMNGISCLKELRKRKYSVPVMMLTAKDQIDDKVEGLDNGADDYLTKPFQIKELLARVRALTRRSSVLIDYQIGNVTLDPNSYELKAVTSVKLTAKEFKLMELFIEHSKSYISSDFMLNSVWNDEDDVDVNVIWVFLSGLRKKLESIGANVTIKSSRGVGYRLEEIVK